MKKLMTICLMAVIVVVLTIFVPQAQANLVVNGGFEQPAISQNHHTVAAGAG